MQNYLFEILSGEYEGENFFVQSSSKESAMSIAKEVARWEEVEYIDAYTDEEAELLGYDTY